MAAPPVTFVQRKTMQLDAASFGVIGGTVGPVTYDNTHPAVTAITGKARGTATLIVIPEAFTTLGFGVTWDAATSSFKAWTQTTTAGAIVFTEVANGVAIGSFQFIMLGQLG